MSGYHLKFGYYFSLILDLVFTCDGFLVIAIANKFCYLLMTNLANQRVGNLVWIWGEKLIECAQGKVCKFQF